MPLGNRDAQESRDTDLGHFQVGIGSVQNPTGQMYAAGSCHRQKLAGWMERLSAEGIATLNNAATGRECFNQVACDEVPAS